MAQWGEMTLTTSGAVLQAKVNANKTELQFTKFKLGSGTHTGNLENVTALAHAEMDIPISSLEQKGNVVTLEGVITNSNVQNGFSMTEIGLMATDPDEGEILYGIMVDPEPDNLPAAGGSAVVSQQFSLGLTMSNTGTVTAVLDSSAFLTRKALEIHDTSPTAHQDIRNLIQGTVAVRTAANKPASMEDDGIWIELLE